MKKYLFFVFIMVFAFYCTNKTSEKSGSLTKRTEGEMDTLCVHYDSILSKNYRFIESCGHFVYDDLADSIWLRISNEDTSGINLVVFRDGFPVKYTRRNSVVTADVYFVSMMGGKFEIGKVTKINNDSIFISTKFLKRVKSIHDKPMIYKVSYKISCTKNSNNSTIIFTP